MVLLLLPPDHILSQWTSSRAPCPCCAVQSLALVPVENVCIWGFSYGDTWERLARASFGVVNCTSVSVPNATKPFAGPEWSGAAVQITSITEDCRVHVALVWCWALHGASDWFEAGFHLVSELDLPATRWAIILISY